MPRHLQDEFDMGRIPIRPLPYENRDKAFTHELMVDSTGENPTYHIFIASTDDPKKLIDLSEKLIAEGFSSQELTVRITGIQEPVSVQQLIEYIYLRFVHIEDVAGFDPEEDTAKVLDTDNKDVILRTINGAAVFPVVRASSIIDANGISLEDRLNHISHLAFIRDSITASQDGQQTFEITYPFANYLAGGNYIEFRLDGMTVSPSQYTLIENTNEVGEAFGCTVTFAVSALAKGKTIDILYLYNAGNLNGTVTVIDGNMIANKSISVIKLNASDSYTMDDPNSVATSRAVYRLYQNISEIATDASSKSMFVKDLLPANSNAIMVDLSHEGIMLSERYIMLLVYLTAGKAENIETIISYVVDGQTVIKRFDCEIPNGAGDGRILKLLVNQSECIVLETTKMHIARNRFFHYCTSVSQDISFKGLDYDSNGVLSVYHNGVRLFEDLDYTMNHSTQMITLTTRPAVRDVIVFEFEYLAH